MRNVLALIGLLVIGFVGLGWYMEWYKLSVTRGSDGNLQITTNVDTKKVGSDSSEFFKNAATVIGSHAEKAARDVKTSVPAGAPGATPGPVATPPIPSVPIAPVATDVPSAITIPVVPPQRPTGPIQLLPPK